MRTGSCWVGAPWPATLLVLLASPAVSCYAPQWDADGGAETDAALPAVDRFEDLLAAAAREGASREGQANCPADSSPLSMLTFSVRTVALGGRYSPRNVGAIWIADADGTWVKTLARWGLRRAKWLTAFKKASGGDTTDAITSATLPGHQVHEVRWNLKGLDGCKVPSGVYALWMELADRSGTGVTGRVEFDKGMSPLALVPEDEINFRDMRLTLR
ncbi:MAG: DUF2271 domain-containing protein [Myxococcales bacterium]|nr:DUF2271 domain-containing protein [Myxococcales bacterium]